jgi:hypothetical protein
MDSFSHHGKVRIFVVNIWTCDAWRPFKAHKSETVPENQDEWDPYSYLAYRSSIFKIRV